jgi:NACalpha-BTF3-like transcription factor
MREYIKALNLYVDWEKGKIYRKKEKNFLDNLMAIFGKSDGEEYEDITTPENELKVKKYKLLELYAIAKKLGKTELTETLNGQEVKVKFEQDKVTVETPEVVMEYTPQKFILKNKKTGEVQEKEPTLREFYQFYKEMKKLLGAGSVENYLHLKAREPEFKQQYSQLASSQMGSPMFQRPSGGFSWGSALLGLGGGMLLGYLLGSMMGEAFAHEVETAPPVSEEEVRQIEEQATVPEEDLESQLDLVESEPETGFEEIPEPTLEDIESDLAGESAEDYFTKLDENALDNNGMDEFADADAFGGEDIGGIDDFGDFDV